MSDRPHLPPFAALRAFEAFGRHGGVRRTAQALGLSHTIVSRHLRGLEDWLGVQLVDRSDAGQNGGGLTAAGLAYHSAIAPAFDALDAATEAVRGGSATRLALWAAPGLAYLWLNAQLPAFTARHPGIAIDLRPSERSPDLARHEADAEIHWTPGAMLAPPPRGTSRAALCRPRVFPVAAPQAPWLRGRLIVTPDDVLACPLLFEDSTADWTGWAAAQLLDRPIPAPQARLWQAHMTLAAAAEGQGVALTNAVLAADHLAAGTLIELGRDLPAFRPAFPGAYTLTTRSDLWQRPVITRLRAWLEERLGAASV